jgi:hypothetical protein
MMKIWNKNTGPDFFLSKNNGVFNLCQHFEISYSRYANKHYITGVYIAINDIYRYILNSYVLERLFI